MILVGKVKSLLEKLLKQVDPQWGLPVLSSIEDVKEGSEFALVGIKSMDEIVAGNHSYHVTVEVSLLVDAEDDMKNERLRLYGVMEQALGLIMSDAINEGQEDVFFNVFGPVRLGMSDEIKVEGYGLAMVWNLVMPVQF